MVTRDSFLPIIVSRPITSPHQSPDIWQGRAEDFVVTGREIIFAITPTQFPQDDQRMAELLTAGYHVEKLPQGNVYIVGSTVQKPENLTIYREPFAGSRNCSPSPTSEARYHLQYSAPNCGILWQDLTCMPGQHYGQTSSHWHTEQYEQWLVLGGIGTLLTRQRDQLIDRWQTTPMRHGDRLTVLPNTEHQIRTTSGLRTFLVMTGDPKGFSLDDHHYVNPPPEGLLA